MSPGDKPILVTAAILLDGESILICQRHHSDAYGLQWEFPGGKIHSGESLEASLRRELGEELGIEATVGAEVFRLRHHYPDRFVEVAFFKIREYQGTIQNLVFEKIEWAPRRELARYRFLEADRGLVEKLVQGEIL